MWDNIFVTFILGAIFGLYMLLVGIALLNRVSFFRGLIRKIEPDDPALMAFAMFGLMLGIVLVGIHTKFEFSPRVLISLLCWAVLLKSIFWIFASDKVVPVIKRVAEGIGYYYVSAIFTILGAILLGAGFYRFIRNGYAFVGL